jgi:Zn-finger nucleic acid-binding protein
MLNCPKCKITMKSALSKKFDVIIEQCQSCKGFWLDEGEIFKFAPSRKKLERYYFDGLQQKKTTHFQCPKCKVSMNQGIIPTLNYEIEQCDSCQGIFLDHGELFGVINGKTTPLQEKNASEYRVKKLPAFFRQALDSDENVLWTQKPNT